MIPDNLWRGPTVAPLSARALPQAALYRFGSVGEPEIPFAFALPGGAVLPGSTITAGAYGRCATQTGALVEVAAVPTAFVVEIDNS